MSATAPAVFHVERPLVAYDLFVDNIPAELKRRPQWVCWQAVKNDNGELDKIPKTPGTAHNASHSDSLTWRSFDEALADVVNSRWDGLGYVFSSGDPYAGVDRDHCVRDGNVDAAVWQDVQALNSYSELSVRGEGLHTVVKGEIARAVKRPEIELYCVKRFFTFTGNILPRTPTTVNDAQEALTRLWARYAEEAPPASKQSSNGKAHHAEAQLPDDAELLGKARSAANGARFAALYDHGDVSAYQGDDSRADEALCCHLAFWTGGTRPASIASSAARR